MEGKDERLVGDLVDQVGQRQFQRHERVHGIHMPGHQGLKRLVVPALDREDEAGILVGGQGLGGGRHHGGRFFP